ncbi:MAG: ComEC/Rec2 family competence protein [Parcubacteria group bacterium]|nr:ComEC/Rec2 family competence protein [Parcubacteria group bacterium]
MRYSRVLVALATGFLLGVFLYSVAGFSWWLIFILVIAAVTAGLAELSGGYPRGFLVFIFLLSVFLGLVRAGTYEALEDEKEQTFWESSRVVLVNKVKAILPQSEASLFNAMFLGYEKDVPSHIKENFNRTGTRHVMAISGMNISIVALMFMGLGISLGLWRQQAFWLAVAGVIIFVLLVGSPPSAARAGVMATLLLWAQNRGRLVQAWRPIMLAAFFMVALNPRLLVFDIGFQLSFLAVLGIMYFKNFWERIFFWIPAKPIRDLVVLSLAAQTTTWPLMLYNFGALSAVSPLGNIFVVPMLNPVMFLGLGFAIVSLSQFLSQLFLWPVWLILKVTIKIVEFFGSFPWASVDWGKSGAAVFIFYPALYFIWRYLENKGWNDALPQ